MQKGHKLTKKSESFRNRYELLAQDINENVRSKENPGNNVKSVGNFSYIMDINIFHEFFIFYFKNNYQPNKVLNFIFMRIIDTYIHDWLSINGQWVYHNYNMPQLTY